MSEFSSRPDSSLPESSGQTPDHPSASQVGETLSAGDSPSEIARSLRSRDLLPADHGVGCSITAVVAATPSGVIGDDQDMPWRLSSDLKRFKKATMGGALIMGSVECCRAGKPSC